MKKHKTLISPSLMKSDERIAMEVELRMAMNESERYKDPKCERLVPCAICGADGDVVRKPFVPVDLALKLKQKGIGKRTSISICICAKCILKLLESDKIYQILNNDELRKLL